MSNYPNIYQPLSFPFDLTKIFFINEQMETNSNKIIIQLKLYETRKKSYTWSIDYEAFKRKLSKYCNWTLLLNEVKDNV